MVKLKSILLIVMFTFLTGIIIVLGMQSFLPSIEELEEQFINKEITDEELEHIYFLKTGELPLITRRETIPQEYLIYDKT